jgi:hypothetical protein
VADEAARGELRVDVDGLAREGARRMVVRNGHARQRQVLTAAGAVAARAPLVEDRRVDPVGGERAVPVAGPAAVVPRW